MRYRNGGKSRIARDLEHDSYLDDALESYLREEGREFIGRIRRDRSNLLELDSYIDDVLESYLLEEGEDSDYAQGDTPGTSTDEMAVRIYRWIQNRPSRIPKLAQGTRLFVAFLVGPGRGVQAERTRNVTSVPDLSFRSISDGMRVNLEVDYDYDPDSQRDNMQSRLSTGIYKHAPDHLKAMRDAYSDLGSLVLDNTRSVFVAMKQGRIKEVRHVSYRYKSGRTTKSGCRPKCTYGCIVPNTKAHVRFDDPAPTAQQAVEWGVLDEAENALTRARQRTVTERRPLPPTHNGKRLDRVCVFRPPP